MQRKKIIVKNPNNLDEQDRTPLMQAVWSNDLQKVREYLTYPDIDVDLQDSRNETALSWASHFGHINIVKVLVDEGKAQLEKTNFRDKTALEEAIWSLRLPVVSFLLTRGSIIHDFREFYRFIKNSDQRNIHVYTCLSIFCKQFENKSLEERNNDRFLLEDYQLALIHLRKLHLLHFPFKKNILKELDLMSCKFPKPLINIIADYASSRPKIKYFLKPEGIDRYINQPLIKKRKSSLTESVESSIFKKLRK